MLAYVINDEGKGRGDPTTWALAEYVTDAQHDGEKVAYVRITNCQAGGVDDGGSVGWAVKEMLATQAQNTRSQSEKAYHLVVSFPDGEKPTREQMVDIEDHLCHEIGFDGHQRISAVHQNTDNWHLHVVINKVHPVTLRNVEPYYDHLRLQAACAELEIRHGLTQDNHVQSPDRPLNGRPAEMEAHAARISFVRWIKEQAGAELIEGAAGARDWQEIHSKFAKRGVVIKPRGAGFIISHVENDSIRIKASDLARPLSAAALTARFGPYQPPAAIPAPTPVVQPPAPAGADEHDDLNPPPLTEYDGPDGDTQGDPRGEPDPADFYDAAPLDTGAKDLWAQFKKERDAARVAKQHAVTVMRAGHWKHTQEMNAWYRQRYANAKTAGLNRGDRISTYQVLSHQRHLDRIDRRARERSDRQVIKTRHQIITWPDFLRRETRAGDTIAAGILERIESTIAGRQNVVVTENASAHRISVNSDKRAPNGDGLTRG